MTSSRSKSSSPLASLRVWRDEIPHGAALNMALDEALLTSDPSSAILRIYSWAEPSISMGYFQKWAEVEPLLPHGVQLMRRWTGGGIVDHCRDRTYSLIVPRSEGLATKRAERTYEEVHEAFRRALALHGVEAELAESCNTCDTTGVGACFAGGHVRHDVLRNGRKIAGAALRRNRSGLLHQGSVQDLEVEDSFWDTFAAELAGEVESYEPEDLIWSAAEELSAGKYETEAWIRRR